MMRPRVRPTVKQRNLLLKLTLSSAFTPSEAEKTVRWLDSPSADMYVASSLIDKAMKRIKERNENRKASEARRKSYRKGSIDDPDVIIAASRESMRDRDRRFGR